MLLALGRPLWRVRLPRRRRRRSARLRRYSSLATSPPSPRPRPDEESNRHRRGCGRGQRGGGGRAGDWCGTHAPTACMGLCIGVFSAAAAPFGRLWAAPGQESSLCAWACGRRSKITVARVGMFMWRGEESNLEEDFFSLTFARALKHTTCRGRPAPDARPYRSKLVYQILPRLDASVHNTRLSSVAEGRGV